MLPEQAAPSLRCRRARYNSGRAGGRADQSGSSGSSIEQGHGHGHGSGRAEMGDSPRAEDRGPRLNARGESIRAINRATHTRDGNTLRVAITPPAGFCSR
ncbi:hypothetical protein GCM10009609_53890 [Pseudonocardia aurantiaca]